MCQQNLPIVQYLNIFQFFLYDYYLQKEVLIQDDLKSYKIARDIKDRVEKELQYPGTVKVTVIRETRVGDYAK